MSVSVVSHPVVRAQLSKLRASSTSPKEFRESVSQISAILAIEATRDLEETTFQGQTPIASFTGTAIKARIGLTPILRAGLGMTDSVSVISLINQSFSDAPIYHLGIFREKVSLQPVEYYSKLPPQPTVDTVFILDPLIATGGTALAAISIILDWGIPIKNIKFLGILASKQGLQAIHAQHPDLEIWLAAIDDTLTDNGLVSPGLGDTGDRLCNTIR
ncbi:PRTase-like protein [Fistulina hepatica ATCC 64428]|uniref:uracil phosphoribosyltransferase n=1 Tax=Fistulina hepatica ATCC 64428 TaxID=1128425 RepID=A0A0D7AKS4_9AGAR|nr:PRTase-like protein [Fistulina hepatica ATCC 64428]